MGLSDKLKKAFKKENNEPLPVVNRTFDNGEDLPKIVFDGRSSLIALGQWMGMLKSVKVKRALGVEIHEHLTSNELDQREKVMDSELQETSREFARLLVQAGVEKSEVVVISDFDEEKGAFKCHLQNTNKDLDIDYRYGSFLDDGPSFTVQEGENVTKYDYIYAWNEYPSYLKMANYTRVNPETKVKYWFYNCEYFLACELEDKDYKLSIHVDYPKDLEDDDKEYFDFDKLRDSLMSIRLPYQADEMFKLVQSCMICSYDIFPAIEIEEKKVTKEQNVECEEITNAINVSNGQLNRFVVTKDNRTITLNGDKSWIHQSDKTIIAEDSQGYVSYHAESILNNNLCLIDVPAEYDYAKEQVQKVNALTLDLLKK